MSKLSVPDLLEQIGSLTLIEAAELKKAMEEKFGVTAAAPMGMMMQTATTPQIEVEVQTEFDAILVSYGEKKLEVLKVVRDLTGLGLKEAKDLVDSVPRPLKEKIKKEEADAMKTKIEAAGGKVDIK